MLQLSGRLERVKEETRHDRQGSPFTTTTFVVQGWGVTFYVDKAREFSGEVPEEGTDVVLEVAPRPYVKRGMDPNQPGGLAVGWIGRGFVTAPATGARVAAVS